MLLKSITKCLFTKCDIPFNFSNHTTHCCPTFLFAGRQPSQQDLILVLDTNILLSHLDYIKNIRSHGLAGI